MTEPFNNHLECEITAQATTSEAFRVRVIDGVAYIVKNTDYEVTELTWFCTDHELDLTDPDEYEWNV